MDITRHGTTFENVCPERHMTYIGFDHLSLVTLPDGALALVCKSVPGNNGEPVVVYKEKIETMKRVLPFPVREKRVA
jgi:hypothetical protein